MRGSVPSLRYKRVVQSLAASLLWALCVFLLHSSESTAQTAAEYHKRATQLAQSKSWDEAVANYRKALTLDPKNAITHYDLALATAWAPFGTNCRISRQLSMNCIRLRPSIPPMQACIVC
jgi:Tfp pilus assembly protein PilF